MPEALARADHDFVLSEAPSPARRRNAQAPAGRGGNVPARGKAASATAGLTRRLLANPSRTIAFGALAAVALGIVVNAMALQKGRHPAPLFVTPAAKSEPVQKAMPPPAPVPRPADAERAVVAEPAAAKTLADAKDPIGQLLLRPHVATDAAEPSKRVLAAQTALRKLGYQLRSDGVMGGTTQQAIEQFERDRGLPVKGELSARIQRELTRQTKIAIP